MNIQPRNLQFKIELFQFLFFILREIFVELLALFYYVALTNLTFLNVTIRNIVESKNDTNHHCRQKRYTK